MRILLLGATGSIGSTFLSLNSSHELVGISYFNNETLAKEIIDKYHLKYYYTPNKNKLSSCTSLEALITATKPDLVINAIVGISGLEATITTIKHHLDIALANKESLVIAGYFIKKMLKANHTKLIPIDSEHTSLQELILSHPKNIKKLYITCSGGRYYNYAKDELNNVSYQEAIHHPNWNMGAKISIDSATLMNKCFEIVEAFYLFDNKNIEALYHPQSIIHSMVQFDDNSIFCNMSQPDMALSINLAINNFTKSSLNAIKPLDFTNLNLTLSTIDYQQWLPIKWAVDIINDETHSLGLIINFANEKAISLFKEQKIKFNQIYDVINHYINIFKNEKIDNIEEIFVFLRKLESYQLDLSIFKINDN